VTTNPSPALPSAAVTKTELLPCPFCGGNFVAQGASRGYISVWCDCGARGPDIKFSEDGDLLPPIYECYAAWNRRAAETELLESLKSIANTYDQSWAVDSQERSIGDKARAAIAKAERP